MLTYELAYKITSSLQHSCSVVVPEFYIFYFVEKYIVKAEIFFIFLNNFTILA